MSTYDVDAERTASPGKVEFGWISQAFKLFGSNPGLWISGGLIAVYGPLVFTGLVEAFSRVSAHVGGVQPGLPHGLSIVISLIDALFSSFVMAGLAQMAVKKVAGHPISGRDIFSGISIYPQFLLFSLIFEIIVTPATMLFVIPGAFIAGLMLPGFALVADGESVGSAISKSFRAMAADRYMATAFAFVLGLVAAIGSGLGFGLPIVVIVSALVYRDMIGLKSSSKYALGPDTLPWETADAKLAYTGKDGDSRFSLSGEPLDEAGNPVAGARTGENADADPGTPTPPARS